MKKFFYMAVAALAALSSCSSDNDPIMGETGETGKQALTFTATMEGGVTRATLNSNKAQWEVDDQININGKAYKATTAGASTTLEADGEEAELVDSKYKAYFPASMYDGTTVTLPASYSYTEDKFDMPMYAESETTNLSFKNLCGVLAITVPSTQMSTVSSIVVSSDQQMNGAISSISDAGVLTFASASPTDAEKKVTLTASAVSIPTDGSKTFYVPVPANTHNPLLITISGGTETKAMITKKSGGVDVARSTIYPINFKENTNAWMNALSLGKTTATKIEIKTDVTTLPTAEDETHKMLNNSGIVWEVLDGTTLSIQTSAPKIIGHDSFGGVGLFEGYSNITSITGLENVDFSEVTDMSSMFKSCETLNSLDLSSFNTSKVTNMSSMFNGCKVLNSLTLSTSFDTSEVTDMNSMFSGCNALTSSGLDLSSLNTSNVTNMSSMFSGCKALTSLDLSNFDTSKVTDMSSMFKSCETLNELVLFTTSQRDENTISFKTSNVEDMAVMFAYCYKLTSLDLSVFDTSNVESMAYMFWSCNELTSLDLTGSFNTSKVTSMYAMFYQCKKLTSLDLSNFDTSDVTNMYTMFAFCHNLSSLTLSNNFKMTNVNIKTGMFNQCGWSPTTNPYGECTFYGVLPATLYVFKYSDTNWNDDHMRVE